jgi:hypothetical protein
MTITLEDREIPLKDLTLVGGFATVETLMKKITKREKLSSSVRNSNLINKIGKMMMTLTSMIALMMNKKLLAISSSRKKSVL